MSYDTESKSRNADFISIAAERQSATFGAKGPVKLTNPWTEGPSILRTLFMQPFYTTRGASRAPFFKIAASAATTSIVIKGLPSDYLLVNTFGDRGQVQSITVSSLANDNYWSIIKSDETNAQTESEVGTDAGAEATSETTEVGSTDNVKGENAEADAVYQKFLNAVSFIKDDSTWDNTLAQFGVISY